MEGARGHSLFGLAPAAPSHFRAWIDRLHPQDGPRVMPRVQQMRASPGENSFNLEFRVLRPDGPPRWLQGLVRAERDAQGRITRMTGIDLDITAHWAETGQLRIEIHDDGIGFDLQSLQQRDAAIEQYGLASSRERLTLIGGRFVVQSRPGKGTTIGLIVPVDGHFAVHHPRAPAPDPDRPARLLLADGRTLARKALTALLSTRGGQGAGGGVQRRGGDHAVMLKAGAVAVIGTNAQVDALLAAIRGPRGLATPQDRG